jgi:hypothetical protein
LKDLPITEQVACQLFELKRKMEWDFADIPYKRILRVTYEDFCKQPESLIEMLKNVLGPIAVKHPREHSFEPVVHEAKTTAEKELLKLIECRVS